MARPQLCIFAPATNYGPAVEQLNDGANSLHRLWTDDRLPAPARLSAIFYMGAGAWTLLALLGALVTR